MNADVRSVAELYEDAFQAHQRGQLDGAAAGYEAVLEREPEHAEALHMLGVAHLQRGDPARAATLIGRAVRIRPEDARAQSNFASALIGAGRIDEAIDVARRASELAPDSADAFGNLGAALVRRNRYPEAIAPLRRALELQPGRAGLHSALGSALGMLREFEAALDSHRKAIELAPDRPQFRSNMARTMQQAGLKGEAEELLRGLVAGSDADPDYFAALASLLRQQGRISEAVGVLKEIRAPDAKAAIANKLTFLQNYVDSVPVAEQLAAAKASAERLTAGIARLPELAVNRDPRRRLRVGFVSSDLRQHAVALFSLGVVKAFDRSQFELFAYSGGDSGDYVNLEFKRQIANWHGTAGLTDDELAETIRRDRIDVLLDLSGPTDGGRLGVFARKPAPVAAIWMGYSGTSGHPAMDYIIGDAEVLPDGVEQAVETAWRLPDAYLCFTSTEPPPAVGPLPADKGDGIRFGSFNNLNKLSDATLDSWAVILAEVPHSRLVLKAHQGSSSAGDTVIQRLVDRGVGRERIEMLGWVKGWCEHLPLYDQVDIGLDPFPYNGTTTTCESLLMGVPVVTLRGDRFIARVGATLMHNVGLDDWIADSVADYVALAVERAGQVEQLGQLRAGLRDRFLASPLADTRRFTRNFEAALRGMWQRYCAEA